MMTDAFTLEEINQACAYAVLPAGRWQDIRRHLEAIAAKRVAKPEAKTCEPSQIEVDIMDGNFGSLSPAPAASPPVCNATYPEVDCLRGGHGKRCHHEACAKRAPRHLPGNCVAGTCCRCGGSDGTSPFNGHHFCSGFCRDRAKAVPRDAVNITGIPDGWKLGDGWTTNFGGECDECTGQAVFTRHRGEEYACRMCASALGAIVPAEPSRPVTGEADWSRFVPTEEIPETDDDEAHAALESQLATRDARIAELEASYAADKAAAVMEERDRCVALHHLSYETESDEAECEAAMRLGTPAPTGSK